MHDSARERTKQSIGKRQGKGSDFGDLKAATCNRRHKQIKPQPKHMKRRESKRIYDKDNFAQSRLDELYSADRGGLRTCLPVGQAPSV